MRYLFFLTTFVCIVFFFCSCKKKDLPSPDPLNAQNTGLNQQSVNIANVTAPCESDLIENQISFSVIIARDQMNFRPMVRDDDDQLIIECRDNSTYNRVVTYIPVKGMFLGKVKYSVKDQFGAYGSNAVIRHSYNDYFYSNTFSGYEGDLYVEYTKTQIIISFCKVKVKDSTGSEHTITGKIAISNSY